MGVRKLLWIFPQSLNQLHIYFEYSVSNTLFRILCFEYSVSNTPESLTLPTMVNGAKDTFRKQVKKV